GAVARVPFFQQPRLRPGDAAEEGARTVVQQHALVLRRPPRCEVSVEPHLPEAVVCGTYGAPVPGEEHRATLPAPPLPHVHRVSPARTARTHPESPARSSTLSRVADS